MIAKKADARAALRDRAYVVLWGVAILGGVQAMGVYLAQRRTAALVLQVVIAEFGTGRLGITWSDPLAPLASGSAIAKRALRGAAFGGAAAVVLVGASVIARLAQIGAGSFDAAPVLIGLVTSAAAGARDELLLRGLVLRALGPRASIPVRLGVCALAGAAFRWGQGDVAWYGVIFAALSSVAFAAFWIRDRGAWLAVGANAAFLFTTGTLAHGALLDARSPHPLDSSLLAVLCSVFFATSAVLWGRKDAAPQK